MSLTLDRDAWVNDALGVDPSTYPGAADADGSPAAADTAAPVQDVAAQPASAGSGVASAAGAPPPDIDAPAMKATDKDVFFSRDSAVLTPDDQAALGAYADRYIRRAQPVRIAIDAFASRDGDASHNQQLSQQRAQAVKDFLSNTKGIKAELIAAAGHGVTSQFDATLAAPNRRATFGPPVPDAPPANPPGNQPGGGQQGGDQSGGGQQGGSSSPKNVSTKCDPTPSMTVTQDQFTKIFGLDLLAQWNAFKSKSGPVPPAAQLSIQLTLKGSLISRDKGSPTVDWFDEPSISVVFNSSGIAANDQEAINLVKLHWDNTILKRPIELSIQAQSQNLFTSGASPQGGLQPQAKVQITKQIGVVVGGQFMLGNGSDDRFNLNAAGFLQLDITAF